MTTPVHVDPWWHGNLSLDEWTAAANKLYPLPVETLTYVRDADGELRVRWVTTETTSDYLEAAA